MTGLALVDRLRSLTEEERQEIYGRCTSEELAALQWAWRDFWARPDVRAPGSNEGFGQVPPDGDWTWWALIGGRSSGKTRSGSELVIEWAAELGDGTIIHLVGATPDVARRDMIDGPSGILACSPPWFEPEFNPSIEDGLLTWPNGAKARVFGAEKPRKGRGPQCNRMWLDDPAAWGPNGLDVLKMLLFGFRLRAPDGSEPRGVISSTDIESEVLDWIMSGQGGADTASKRVYSRSISDDNRANLSETYFTGILTEFAGSDLEQQERYGKRIDTTGAHIFHEVRFDVPPVRIFAMPELRKKTVSVDPAESGASTACEVGIVYGGLDENDHPTVVEDASLKATAATWPKAVVDLAEKHGATRIIVETNRGSDWPEQLIHAAEKLRRVALGLPALSMLTVVPVRAEKKKSIRAGLVVPLAKRGSLHFLFGMTELERQLRSLTDEEKGKLDRADAAVHLVLDLAGGLTLASYDGQKLQGPAPRQSVVVTSSGGFQKW